MARLMGDVGRQKREHFLMKLLGKLLAGVLAVGGIQAEAGGFEPTNDLERSLIQAQAGKLSVPDFFTHLQKSQVVILLDGAPPQSGVWDNNISPLVLRSSTGSNMLAVFTSKERATPMTQQSKQHQYALLTDFSWVLKGVATGVGIVVNPGWPVGLEIQSSRVAELKSSAK
jgi:hypothetical protein